MRKKKNAQMSIIVVVLITLIVIVAVTIVWNVVMPLISEKSEDVEIGVFTTDLEIDEASVGTLQNSRIVVKRKRGELDSLRFVFYDGQGNSAVDEREDIPEELGSKTYSFSAFENLGKLVKIEVYPVVNNKSGIYDESRVSEELSPYFVFSWKKGDNSTIKGLEFNNNMGISFLVDGNEDKFLMSQGYNLKIKDKKIVFTYQGEEFGGEEELINGLNHVVVSIGSLSNIHINNIPSHSFNLNSFNSNGDLIIGNIDNLMIFNKSLDSFAVSGLFDL